MNKLADEYRKTLEAEDTEPLFSCTKIIQSVDVDQVTALDNRITALANAGAALSDTVATMAENQLKTLRHVADLTARLEKLEKRAKSRIIGLN